MKKFIAIVLMLATIPTIGQSVPTNEPNLINPIIQNWIHDATIHGVDISRLKTIKAINVIPTIKEMEAGADWSPADGEIRIARDKLHLTDGIISLEDLQIKLYHEIGHHYGVRDCYVCKYHVMSGNANLRRVYLYKDIFLKTWIDDEYFKALKDAKSHNQNHPHR